MQQSVKGVKGAVEMNTAASRNKLVIRRLPPTLPEDIFWKSLDPWISDGKCQWKRYIQGRTGVGYAEF
jgi:regulator of nonsense transcripts 3